MRPGVCKFFSLDGCRFWFFVKNTHTVPSMSYEMITASDNPAVLSPTGVTNQKLERCSLVSRVYLLTPGVSGTLMVLTVNISEA